MSETDASNAELIPLVRALERTLALMSATDSSRAMSHWPDLRENLRYIPQILTRLRADAAQVQRLEEQVAELLDRLVVMETALRSAHEARDAAALLLAEVWFAATGRREMPAPEQALRQLNQLRRLNRSR